MINNWDILQEKNLLSSVHAYNTLPEIGINTRADPLAGVENEVFFPVLKDCSVPLKGIATHQAKAAWHSPAVDRAPNKYADHYLMDHAEKDRQKLGWLEVHGVEFNTLINATHNIVIREELPNKTWGEPKFAICGLPNGMSFCWPALERTMKGRDGVTHYIPRVDPVPIVEDCHCCFYNMLKWQAPSFVVLLVLVTYVFICSLLIALFLPAHLSYPPTYLANHPRCCLSTYIPFLCMLYVPIPSFYLCCCTSCCFTFQCYCYCYFSFLCFIPA